MIDGEIRHCLMPDAFVDIVVFDIVDIMPNLTAVEGAVFIVVILDIGDIPIPMIPVCRGVVVAR